MKTRTPSLKFTMIFFNLLFILFFIEINSAYSQEVSGEISAEKSTKKPPQQEISTFPTSKPNEQQLTEFENSTNNIHGKDEKLEEDVYKTTDNSVSLKEQISTINESILKVATTETQDTNQIESINSDSNASSGSRSENIDVFVPSEEISEDSTVPFPADI